LLIHLLSLSKILQGNKKNRKDFKIKIILTIYYKIKIIQLFFLFQLFRAALRADLATREAMIRTKKKRRLKEELDMVYEDGHER